MRKRMDVTFAQRRKLINEKMPLPEIRKKYA